MTLLVILQVFSRIKYQNYEAYCSCQLELSILQVYGGHKQTLIIVSNISNRLNTFMTRVCN